MSKQKWCPTQGGTFTAYDPEWLDSEDWRQVPTKLDPSGVPEPRRNGGVISAIGLYGYAQAQALAWGFAACAESRGKDIEVRVQPYEVVYDIKARKSTVASSSASDGDWMEVDEPGITSSEAQP